MRVQFGFHSANWLAGGIPFVILAVASGGNSPALWPYALASMSLVSFAAWIGNYHRLRQIADTPVSNIASAAQGYVEIAGRAEEPGGVPIRSGVTGLPCVWCHYEIYEKSGRDEQLLEAEDSADPFLLTDATGQCVIDPEDGEVITSRKRAWTEGNRRYVEWLLLPQDPIYAIGEFTTVGGADGALELYADVGALLAEWKKNQPELLKRFDLNRDGKIDLREWELARRQARREVEAQQRNIGVGTNLLRKPADGRLFLISNYLPGKLRNIYLAWAWLHMVLFIAASAGAFALFELIGRH